MLLHDGATCAVRNSIGLVHSTVPAYSCFSLRAARLLRRCCSGRLQHRNAAMLTGVLLRAVLRCILLGATARIAALAFHRDGARTARGRGRQRIVLVLL